MIKGDILWKFPELKDFLDTVNIKCEEIKNWCRPPEQIILDDVAFREFLKISKRTAAMYREQGMITYYKVCGKIYYKLSDVLAFIDKHKIPSIESKLRIK